MPGYGQPYSNVDNYNFHQIVTIISGIATILCCIICCAIAIGHLLFYVKPREQKQLLRVIFTLPIFAICSFFGCWFYNIAPYLRPFPQIWEALGIVALFYFYVNCVTPNDDVRKAFYDGLERQKVFQRQTKHDNGSLRWFYMIWILIFQVYLGRIGTTIVFEYFEATLCPLDPRLQRRTTIITVIQSIQTTIAVVGVILYEGRMRIHLQEYRPLGKLVTFKVVLPIEAFQNFIFQILALPGVGVFAPTYHISTYDFSVGIPAFMLCCELLFFALSFWWSFSYTPYRKLAAEGRQKFGFWRGMWDVINITDIIDGIGYLLKTLAPSSFGKKYVQRQRPSDATMVAEDHAVKFRVMPVQGGTESEPESLQKESAQAYPKKKV